MQIPSNDRSLLLEMIVEHIDVPKSYYEKAADRHESLGRWLHRKESAVAQFDPDVRPQGSFRYGTVIRPINEGDEYDLDNVCLLQKLAKSVLTQEQLKHVYGEEIKAYAKANGMLAPVTEHHRCWRLSYADEIPFHLDTLPCVPEEEVIMCKIETMGVTWELARRLIAITDKRHPRYREVTLAWLSSNPRGFAAFFEQRAAMGRERMFQERQIRAAIEEVPPYEWKTTLQRSIQVMKRHRDVMFRNNCELAPISMVITNLAAQAYGGEPDLGTALLNIVDKMPRYVRSTAPRVPNPADPLEDYADKWSRDTRLIKSFWDWHTALKADLERLLILLGRTSLKADIRKLFLVDLTEDEVRQFPGGRSDRPSPIVKVAPAIAIPSASKPWGMHG
ncbi:MAG TPA: nucleotidyltransferase [Planctomycetaceae bacterium]|jgi:hypothetical protein|nr:nucleotidyltransferase [Planctomycetaceae bacterium]